MNRVRLLHGNSVNSENRIKINVSVYDGNKWIEKHLVDVLYVPRYIQICFHKVDVLIKAIHYIQIQRNALFVMMIVLWQWE